MRSSRERSYVKERFLKGDDSVLKSLHQLKKLSRLSLKPKQKTSKDYVTDGSHTRRESATDENVEALSRQSSLSSTSGLSSTTNGRGNFYRLKPPEHAGSSTRSFYHYIDSQAELEDLNSTAGHTPFPANTPARTPTPTPKDTLCVDAEGMS